MLKLGLAAAALWVSVIAPSAPVAGTADAGAPTCIPADKCCSVCDAGQACGNSCISRKKTCHKGRGCACNAAEVCAR